MALALDEELRQHDAKMARSVRCSNRMSFIFFSDSGEPNDFPRFLYPRTMTNEIILVQSLHD